MSEDSSFSNYPSYGEKNSRKSHFVAFFFIILIIVIIILVGLYFLGASKKGTFNPLTPSNNAAAPTPLRPTDSAGQAPTSTPTPLPLDRGDLSITVLNGSGVAGAAGDVSEVLKDLGYTVKSTGNASKFDYTGITILISEDKKAYGDLLKKDLADEAETIEVEVDDNLKADAEVIVGK